MQQVIADKSQRGSQALVELQEIDRLDPQMIELLADVFPRYGGIEFLALMLRHAEIKQNVLPGMENLGTYVAVINVSNVRELAKKIGWGYDTTHKYEIIFCALRLVFKQRLGKYLQLVFPMQRHQLPSDLHALDNLIQHSRPKVKQFAHGVKERLLAHNYVSMRQTTGTNSRYATENYPGKEPIMLHQLLHILQSEGINTTKSKHLALRISSEILGTYMLSSESATKPAIRWPEKLQRSAISANKPSMGVGFMQSRPTESEVSLTSLYEETEAFSGRLESSQLRTSKYKRDRPAQTTPIGGCSIEQTYARQPEMDSEAIIKRAQSRHIPQFALEVLKKGLARNAVHKQEEDLCRDTLVSAEEEQEDYYQPQRETVVYHQTENVGWSTNKVDPINDGLLEIVDQPTSESSLGKSEVDFSTFLSDRPNDKVDFSNHEVDFSQKNNCEIMDIQQEKLRQELIKQIEGEVGEIDLEGLGIKDLQRFLNNRRNQAAWLACEQEIVDEERNKYTPRVPRMVDLLVKYPLLRNYVTLNIKDIINNIYTNVTLRKEYLGKFFNAVFDHNDEWTWYDKVINDCQPHAMLCAFIDVMLHLHDEEGKKIQRPGGLFIKKCRKYQDSKLQYPEKYKQYEMLSYEDFVILLEKHAIFNKGVHLA